MKKDRDIVLVVFILLVCIGAVILFSSSAIYSYDKKGDTTFFLKKHLIYLGIGTVVFLFFLVFSYKKLENILPYLLFLNYILLILVFVQGIGYEVGGAKRWLSLGFVNFQPSEITKLVMIIYLASFVSRKGKLIETFKRGFLPPVIVCLSVSALVILQPDWGSAAFLVMLTLILLIIAGVRWRHLLSICLASLPFIYFSVLNVGYRRDRIIAFLNPWRAPRSIGFQLIQSYLAFGSGGVFGVGLGKSKQKLFYLPASHTDFIFSIIGEELGFIGTAFVLVLFAILCYMGFKIAKEKTDTFARFLAMGITVNISLQVILNISVVTGLLPTKGLPLPFLSYGGTNLIMNIIQIGLLLNISKNAL